MGPWATRRGVAKPCQMQRLSASQRVAWTRRGFLITWGAFGVGATLLAACGPAVATAGGHVAHAAPGRRPRARPRRQQPVRPRLLPTRRLAPPCSRRRRHAIQRRPPKDGGTFKFSQWTDDPPSLDPYLNVSFRAQEFAAFFYSRLLMSKKGPGMAGQAYIMEGDLAESWKPSEDGKTWTFNLRPEREVAQPRRR